MSRRVVITGMGMVTPLGLHVEEVWKRLLNAESGISRTTRFDASTFPTTFSAEVKGFSLDKDLPDTAARHADAVHNVHFALAAAAQAMQNAGLSSLIPTDRSRIGIYLGGGEGPPDFTASVAGGWAGCIDDNDNIIPFDTTRWARVSLNNFRANYELELEANQAASHVAVEFNVQGPSFNTLTACAASTQAIGEASEIIRYGDADVMITGGAHSMIHPLGVTGFNRLTALSQRNDDHTRASRPFDRTRDGFVLGEGAGMLILEELEHALERGATIHAEVLGFGSTADAFRVTDMHESGRGPMAAIHAALTRAGVSPQDIDYISAHGTGTQENDKIETLAIREVFGEFAKQVPISSIKSMTGHLIAAAGAVELITCVLAIRDGIVPPTANYSTPDPECDLDYVPNKARKVNVRTALSNSFGFGGQNDTVIIRRFDA